VPAVGRNGATVFVRINAVATGLAFDDADAACRAGAFGLFVAKVQSPAELARLDELLDVTEREVGRERPMALVPMLEDPGAVLDARAIAAASRRTFALVSGSEDMATAMGAEPTPEVLRLPKLLVHLAAKAAGLVSFGMLRTVADFKDAEAVAASAREARAFGFDGASCIHPSVVPILNAAFTPTPAELDRARRMVEAFEAAKAAGEGAFRFEDKMVDEPVVARARALLARHK
jgi:citrate lyase subunit beta / citryl-CoA lyase